ncbi:MFS transporter [Candidatus Leptofilum sp.]|uniref:MFS transporter n=1 Tax=Candidatus Leptofilum sp. TaxID=3241576 RepID=UPI003B594BDA
MNKKVTAYFFAFIALGMASAALGPTLPGLAEQTSTQLSGISFLFATRSLGFLAGSILAGRIYDRLPGHPILMVLLVSLGISLLLVPLIPQLWLLTILMFLAGTVESGIDVGGNTLMVWRFGEKVGPYMNSLHFFFGVGAFLSPIIIAQTMLVTEGSIRLGYWVLAIMVLPALLLFIRFPSPPIRTRDTAVQGQITNLPIIALVAAFMFLYVGAEVAYGGWVYTYAITLDLSTETAAAYLTSFFWGALTVGRLISIPLTAKFHPKTMLGGALAGCVASMLILLTWRSSTAVLWAGTIGLGLSMSVIFPTTLSWAEHTLSLSGKMTSYFFVGASLGAMSIPWLIGQLFESVGARVTMVTIFVTVLLAVAIFGLLVWQARLHQEAKSTKLMLE